MYTVLFDFKEDRKLKQVRLDSKGNVLEKGEYYRDYDGRYVYNYKNPFNGKRVSLYAVSLDSLRDKEKDIMDELQNSIEKYRNKNITLNDIFEDYVASRISWSKGTEANNVSMYNRHIKNSIGRLKLINIKKDTVRKFLKNNGDDINNALKRIIKKYNNHGTYNYSKNADVEYLPDISVHVFRHTFCTRLCEIEHNVRVIQDIMGHNNIRTTLEIYNTVNTECKSSAMEKFEEVMKEL